MESDTQSVEVKLNQGASAFGLTVLPKAVLEDSRCPSGVQCIWAGQVRVQAQVTSAMGTGNQIFVLGTPVKTEAEVVTLTEVRPAAASGATISPEDYEFVFEIEKR